MPTLRQKNAVNALVEKRGSISEAMRAANYDETTVKNPKNLTESKGFKELCEQAGLTDDFLLNALVDDIKGKPKNRKAELELGFRVKGRLQDKENGGGTTNNIIVFGNEQSELVARRLLARSQSSEEESSGLRDSDEQKLSS